MSAIDCAFLGTLGSDAERKVSKAGKTYLRLRVRVRVGDNAQRVSALVFDPDAINVADELVKGRACYVEGKLTLDKWTGQDGAERHCLADLRGRAVDLHALRVDPRLQAAA